MINLFGAIGLSESDRLFNGTIGQRVIYEATQEWIDLYNLDLVAATEIFVNGRTDKAKERYRLPGGGMMQRRGRSALPGAVKAGGYWDVGYPLIDFGDVLATDDITYAYMTTAEYSLHLQNISNRDVNTYRFEMLRAMFNNLPYVFQDETLGAVNVQSLANGDATLYPPVLGSAVESTASLFGVAGYAPSLISDVNNPIKPMVAALQARFGTPTGGSNIAIFINNSERAAISALTDFVRIQYRFVQPGVNTATVIVPGVDERLLKSSWEVIGTCSGAVICQWAFITPGYLMAVHMDAPPPLVERIDPINTGLGAGLQLVMKDQDLIFQTAFWRHRYGIAVQNRLNGYLMQIVAPPTMGASAIQNATALTVNAIPQALPTGTVFNFAGVTATLTAPAATGAVSLVVAPIANAIANGVLAGYGVPTIYQ